MGQVLITFGLIIISAGITFHFFADKLSWFGNLRGIFNYKGEKNAYLPAIYQHADY